MQPPTLVENTPVGALYLYPQDLIGMTLAGGQFWDGELLLPLFDQVQPGEVVVNIGAYIGHEAIYLAEKRGAKVLAVEANPAVYTVLVQNLLLHKLGLAGPVYPLLWAAYDESRVFEITPGQVDDRRDARGELDLSAPGSVGSLGFTPTTGEGVPGGALDPWVELYFGGGKVSLIECDAQGCDLRALKGLRRTIARWKPAIVFEYEGQLAAKHGDDWKAHEAFIEEIGYSFSESATHGQNYIARPREAGPREGA